MHRALRLASPEVQISEPQVGQLTLVFSRPGQGEDLAVEKNGPRRAPVSSVGFGGVQQTPNARLAGQGGALGHGPNGSPVRHRGRVCG